MNARILSTMSSGQTFMLLLSLMCVAAFSLIMLLFRDWYVQVISSSLLLLILILGSRIALPPEAHRMKSVRYAIWMFGGVLLLVAGLRTHLDALAIVVVANFSPEFASVVERNPIIAPTSTVVAAAVVMLVAVLWFFRDQAPLGVIAPDKMIRQASYLERRSAFVAVLKSRLEQLDDELRWHHNYFVALRAEVDVRNAKLNRRRVGDLVEAIKINQDADVFVVVGVPGAGKSVALRKCCMDLLTTQRPNERIPIYVNLKEWSSIRRWSADEPPTDDEFSHFVRSNIRDRLPDITRAFFDEHFERMVDAGELFFMFDSFDEIPGVLDADETSRLLDSVSAVIVRYLRGQAGSRGVIASRYYRRPRLGQLRHVQLDVRPFSEQQISQAVAKGASRPQELRQILFVDRPDLGALARNPFSFSLILLYWESRLEAPPNQSAVYSAYIEESLKNAQESLDAAGLNADALRLAMAAIAWAMFESDRRGLEMTVAELRAALVRDDVDVIVDTLVSAKLARKAPRTQAVSFVHRRFNEYFLVARWLSGEREPPFEAIPTDSRYRDALVLYAEVADEVEAKRLAAFCWQQIASAPRNPIENASSAMRAIYALRFLSEAFRALPGPIEPFRGELGHHVLAVVRSSDDILTRKIAVEAVGLLDPVDAEAVLLFALSRDNRWITDTALFACRYLPALSPLVVNALVVDLASRAQNWILVPDREFKFALGVADAFGELRCRFRRLRVEMWLGVILGAFCLGFLEYRMWGLGWSVLIAMVCIATVMNLFVAAGANAADSGRNSLGTARRSAQFIGGRRSFVNGMARTIITKIALRDLKRQKLTNIHSTLNKTLTIARTEPAMRMLNIITKGAIDGIIGIVRTLPLFSAMIMFVVLASIQRKSIDPDSPLNALKENYNDRLVFSAFVFLYFMLSVFRYYSIFGAIDYNIRRVCKIIFISSLYIAGLAAVTMFVLWIAMLFTYFRYVLSGVVFLSCAAISLDFAGAFLDYFKGWHSDRRRFAEATGRFNPSREVIAASFESFATSAARLRYVEWVEQESAATRNQLVLANIAGNPWPEDRRPNFGDDEGSILLARLDARWVGLEA
ncbi:NACHT domain-containing protein [Mycoplana rhizolycopersici]|uniref:NACHT domain-containing protein n=1 Tax=Mycoplana rhizolycopersici TaxID=2746702 RepID=A0ABX2QI90_9HYPH|nr:NACHT domain-containing protein [Rhizobium rhizolycopersici]NVP56054.1 NACHT domain-containing protein [Rhizobium rhizolycopersici]